MDFHGTFMGRDGEATLRFYEQKLYYVDIMFDGLKSETLYDDLLTLLQVTYGQPNETEQNAHSTVEEQLFGRSILRGGDLAEPFIDMLQRGLMAGRIALWCGNVTHICLLQEKGSKYVYTSVQYSDWKTFNIAHEREKQYNRKTDKK